MKPDKPGLSTEQARELLKAAGMRSTASRIAVLQHVAKSEAPVAHLDVANTLVPEGYDKSTVYRCLVEMADANLLKRHDFGDHVWRFEYAAKQHDSGDHAHFVCVDCGKVECLPEVEIQVKGRPGEAAEKMPRAVTDVMLKGHCDDCQD